MNLGRLIFVGICSGAEERCLAEISLFSAAIVTQARGFHVDLSLSIFALNQACSAQVPGPCLCMFSRKPDVHRDLVAITATPGLQMTPVRANSGY